MSQAIYEDSATRREPSTGWTGWITFAATIMIIGGALNAFYGLVALLNDEWVVFGNQANLYLDITEWGWIHLIVGLIVLASGVFLFTGNVLARTVGVIVAGLSIILNFMWLPAYPIWSVIIITMNVLIIYALTAHGRDMAL